MGQLDLLHWSPPALTHAFDPSRVRGVSWAGRIARAVSEALRDCGIAREDVAARMSAYLGREVRKSGLDAFASEARVDRSINVEFLAALVHVTRDRRLVQILADVGGWAVVERRHLPAPEVDPRAAFNLLPDYERVLGPDPCGRDALPLSIPQRQTLAFQRWTARGGQAPQFYIDLAATMGVAITIQEFVTSQVGVMECGDELIGEGQQFYWLVTLPAEIAIDFHLGSSATGDALGEFAPSLVQCVIQQFAPAHTIPVFAYTGPGA